MFSPAYRCQIGRIKTQYQDIRKQDGIHSDLDQSVQDFIILFQHGHCLSSDKPSGPAPVIMMTVLALITAELFVRPSITDLVSTLQASGDFPWSLLQISHGTIIFS